jgi:regulator of replication initiation timing
VREKLDRPIERETSSAAETEVEQRLGQLRAENDCLKTHNEHLKTQLSEFTVPAGETCGID